MAIVLNGTTGITNDGGYTGDGVVFADTTPANTLVTTTGGNVGIGTSSPGQKLVTASNATNSKIEIQNTSTAASTSKTSALQFTGTDTVGTLKETGDIYVTPADNDYVGSNMVFYTRGSDALTERARINSSGNFGVGTSSPTSPYRVDIVSGVSRSLRVRGTSPGSYGADSAVLVSAANDAAVEFYNDSTGKYWRVVQDGSGNFDFGVSTVTNSFTHTFYDSGAAAKRDGAGSWIGTSDERLKTNFAPITASEAWTRISKLNPTKYQWAVQESHSNQAGDQFGFKAQDWQKAYPTSVYEMVPSEGEKHLIPEGEKALGLAFNADFYADLVAVIQEQQTIITALTARVTALEGA